MHGTHPIELMRLEAVLMLADLSPTVEIIGKILVVLDMDDFRQVPVKQRESPLRASYANGHVIPVQDQHMTIQP